MKGTELRTRAFNVNIPNLDGDGIAETVPIEVQVYTDSETGEEVLTPESLELIEKTKARRMGLLSAKEIRALRQRLDLTQEEMSELLQIGAKTYTRWESGQARPSRSMNVLLKALDDGALSLAYLRSLRGGVDWEPLTHRRLRLSIIAFDTGVQRMISADPLREFLLANLNTGMQPDTQLVMGRILKAPPKRQPRFLASEVCQNWEKQAEAA